jgi:hypothetical protein
MLAFLKWEQAAIMFSHRALLRSPARGSIFGFSTNHYLEKDEIACPVKSTPKRRYCAEF